MTKPILLALYLCLTTMPSFADNDEFVFKMMRSNLDTQLENEGFDAAAIDLVHLVGGLAAHQKICGIGGMKDGLIEFAANKVHVPVAILVEKAKAYMDLDVYRARQTYSDLQYCRRLEEMRQNGK